MPWRFVVVALLGCVVLGASTAWQVRSAWIRKRIEMVRHPQPRTTQVSFCAEAAGLPLIVVGDSRISQWPREMLAPDVANRGLAGETVAQLALRFDADVLACRPRAILIASGINDLVGASFLSMTDGLRIADQVAETLIRLGDSGVRSGAEVYVATLIPPGRPSLVRRLVWSWTITGYVERVNTLLRDHRWSAHAHVLDLAGTLTQGATLPASYRLNTLHLNAAAYRCLTTRLPSSFSGLPLDETACQT